MLYILIFFPPFCLLLCQNDVWNIQEFDEDYWFGKSCLLNSLTKHPLLALKLTFFVSAISIALLLHTLTEMLYTIDFLKQILQIAFQFHHMLVQIPQKLSLLALVFIGWFFCLSVMYAYLLPADDFWLALLSALHLIFHLQWKNTIVNVY